MTGAAAISGTERERIAAALAEIACAAGEVLRGYHRGPCPHVLKADGSPSSAADVEAEHLIVAALAARFPGIAVIAEESAQTGNLADRPAGRFFLVDPLDGTRDFLAGAPDYSVNIALVAGERPVAAALAAPGIGRVWWAGTGASEADIAAGRPAAGRPVRTRPAPEAGLLALGSRRHGDSETASCLAALPVLETRRAGSALKFGLIAAGEADIYVRCGPTMEWDTAAGDHIVTAAGGRVVIPGGGPIRYGRHGAEYRNGPFAALGDPALAAHLDLPAGRPAARPPEPVLTSAERPEGPRPRAGRP